MRGSGLAGDELHRRRDRGTVVGRVARREVSTQHRDGLRDVDLIRREPGRLEAAEALRVVDERLYRTAERLEVVVLHQSEEINRPFRGQAGKVRGARFRGLRSRGV